MSRDAKFFNPADLDAPSPDVPAPETHHAHPGLSLPTIQTKPVLSAVDIPSRTSPHDTPALSAPRPADGPLLTGPHDAPSHASPRQHDSPTPPLPAHPTTLSVPARGPMSKKPIEVSTVEEYKKALESAKGAVVVDFVAQDCGFCDEAKPVVDKLAKGCDVTVVRVDVEKVEQLAEEFGVEGTPTTLYAKSAAEMVPGTAEEVDPEDATFRARLKCARTRKEK